MLTDARDPFGSSTENTVLADRLRQRIRRDGPITFRDFMATVAHDPLDGYYASRAAIGAAGDFITSPEVHPLFGALLARQACECWEFAGKPGSFLLVEQGADSGKLARALLDALPAAMLSAVTYCIVEPHARLREVQRQTLGSLVAHADWAEALPPAINLLISNELPDSFAVHRVIVRSGRLLELYVALDDDGDFIDRAGEPSTPAIERYFEVLGLLPGEGCVAEVNLDALDWMHTVGAHIARGLVLTLDYGYPAARLYAHWRKQGTLLCFFRHSTSTDPYQRVGRQDITAHIDFTSLARAGREAGLTPIGFTTQRGFLTALGANEALAAGPEALGLEEFLGRRRAVETLLDPEGLGRIRVLAQCAGFEPLPRLRGFAENDLAVLS
jgi:SAM-dependent MidA family methyltransferase